jgi:hypothetical protein
MARSMRSILSVAVLSLGLCACSSETACEAQCQGRQCGGDSCGGTCAPGCTASETCDANGQCVGPCGSAPCAATEVCYQDQCCDPAASCSGKACGSDGCGGTCAPGCSSPQTCGLDGQCHAGASRMRLTIDHAVLAKTASLTGNVVNPTVGPLADFPLMIHLGASSGKTRVDATDVFTVLGDSSKKLAITTSDETTECYVEIVRWDSTNREGYLWIRVPLISYSEDTVLHLFYDSSMPDNDTHVGVTRSAPAEAVWDSDFAGVWHLAEIGSGAVGEFRDSTSNHHDGQGGGGLLHDGSATGSAPTRVVGGTTGYAQHFESGKWITVPTTNGDWSVYHHLDTGITITHFATADNINWSGSSSGNGLQTVQFGNSVDGYQWEVWPCSADSERPQNVDAYIFGLTGGYGDGGAARAGDTDPLGPHYANNQWTSFGALYDAGHTAYAIWNGMVYRGGSDPGGFLPDSPYGVNFSLEGGLGETFAPLSFGTSYNRQSWVWAGNISEIHISRITRSDSWIAAEFYSGMDNMVTLD